jgi:ComF family protein
MVNIWPIIDQAFGSCCPICRAPGDGICAGCDAVLPRNRHPCRRCALPLPASAARGSECPACQRRPPAFDRALAPLLYQAPVDDLVSRFKYHHQLDLGRLLAAALAEALQAHPFRPDLLLPVPMSADSLAARGFNQAAELAAQLSRRLAIPWAANRLRRDGSGRHQRGLDRRARLRNLRGAFSTRGRLPAQVAIIDDVLTTGATVEEVSRTLRRAGVERIEVWTVARTPIDRAGGSG